MKNIVIDLHCDTVLKLYKNKRNTQFKLKNALKYDKYVQCFAMYIEPEYVENSDFELCLKLINVIKKEVEKNKEYIYVIKTSNDLEKYFNCKNNKLGVILTVEDAVCLEGDINNLDKLYEEGIRVIGLTWNNKNQVGCGVNYNGGLTEFGKEVVNKMNDLGVIIDVSHLSDQSFYDVMDITKKPVIASHSNSRYICDNKRNLSDAQIKLIADNGGIIGLNFYKKFVSKNANLKKLIEHIKHIKNIAGIDCISLGSDYDGVKNRDIIKGLKNNSKLNNLVKILKKENFSDEEIDKIMWKNALTFLAKNLNKE